jgi:hypothetical protein
MEAGRAYGYKVVQEQGPGNREVSLPPAGSLTLLGDAPPTPCCVSTSDLVWPGPVGGRDEPCPPLQGLPLTATWLPVLPACLHNFLLVHGLCTPSCYFWSLLSGLLAPCSTEAPQPPQRYLHSPSRASSSCLCFSLGIQPLAYRGPHNCHQIQDLSGSVTCPRLPQSSFIFLQPWEKRKSREK